MVAVGSLPGIGGVDPSSRLAFLEVLRRLVAVEAVAGTGGGGGVTAHSALTGLTIGDDHPQYLNTTRGDARYPLKSNNLSEFTATAATARSSLGLGTAAVLNVAVTGNAAAGEVVKGNDTRLSDARTPSAHVGTHSSIGTDPIVLGGDLTGGVNNAVIATNAVSNAKLALVATQTFKGRTTAATGNVEDLTATQATAMLNVFTTSLKGLVPSGGSSTTYLRGDATWQTLSSLATLVPPGTVGTVLRGNGTFAAPTIISVATGTPQTLAAADTYVTGSALALASRQQVGTIMRWRMSISKTASGGVAAPIINLRWGTLGTTADVARFTFTGTAQTNVVDSAFLDIEAVITTLNATTGALAWSLKFGHNLSATGFGTIPMQVSALSSGVFDTTTANAIVGISINAGASSAWTMRAVYAEAFNLL